MERKTPNRFEAISGEREVVVYLKSGNYSEKKIDFLGKSVFKNRRLIHLTLSVETLKLKGDDFIAKVLEELKKREIRHIMAVDEVSAFYNEDNNENTRTGDIIDGEGMSLEEMDEKEIEDAEIFVPELLDFIRTGDVKIMDQLNKRLEEEDAKKREEYRIEREKIEKERRELFPPLELIQNDEYPTNPSEEFFDDDEDKDEEREVIGEIIDTDELQLTDQWVELDLTQDEPYNVTKNPIPSNFYLELVEDED